MQKNPKKEKEKNKVNGKYPRRRSSPPNADILKQYTDINQYQNISFPWANWNGHQNGIDNHAYSSIGVPLVVPNSQWEKNIYKNYTFFFFFYWNALYTL